MPLCRERPPRQSASGTTTSPAPAGIESTATLSEPSYTVGLFHDRIVTTVPIGFTPDDQTEAAATPVLDAVADVLKDNPTLELVEVAVHLPEGGPDWRARLVSSRRASWVTKELSRRGVEKPRLLAQGYGFLCPAGAASTTEVTTSAPLPPDETSGFFASAVKDSALRLSESSISERVEFIVLTRDGKPTRQRRGCGESERARLKLEVPNGAGGKATGGKAAGAKVAGAKANAGSK